MADLIKKIKIKKQDGTFTDYIPIGADATNVIVADGESAQVKLNKKPYYYNTIADMKADSKLKNGDMVITLGYYTVNDGGGAKYVIVSGQYTDDQGSHHELDNGLFAELIIENEEINVLNFGIVASTSFRNISNQTSRMTQIIRYALTNNIRNIYIPKGYYMFSINLIYEETVFDEDLLDIEGVNRALYLKIRGCAFNTKIKAPAGKNGISIVGQGVNTGTFQLLFGVDISNLMLYGNNTYEHGIIVQYAQNINLSNIYIYNFYYAGITLTTAMDMNIFECEIFYCGIPNSEHTYHIGAFVLAAVHGVTNAIKIANCRVEHCPCLVCQSAQRESSQILFENIKYEKASVNTSSIRPIHIMGANSIMFNNCIFTNNHATAGIIGLLDEGEWFVNIASPIDNQNVNFNNCSFITREGNQCHWGMFSHCAINNCVFYNFLGNVNRYGMVIRNNVQIKNTTAYVYEGSKLINLQGSYNNIDMNVFFMNNSAQDLTVNKTIQILNAMNPSNNKIHLNNSLNATLNPLFNFDGDYETNWDSSNVIQINSNISKTETKNVSYIYVNNVSLVNLTLNNTNLKSLYAGYNDQIVTLHAVAGFTIVNTGNIILKNNASSKTIATNENITFVCSNNKWYEI